MGNYIINSTAADVNHESNMFENNNKKWFKVEKILVTPLDIVKVSVKDFIITLVRSVSFTVRTFKGLPCVFSAVRLQEVLVTVLREKCYKLIVGPVLHR